MRDVSIVIPCQDHWHLLDECLASVAAQTHEHWEAIVVDDASTERGFTELRHRWPDPRIRWSRHLVSRGPGPARNTGVRSARHDIIVTLDSDDLLQPTYLEKLLREMVADPLIDCVFPNFELFGIEHGVREFHVPENSELAQWQQLPAQVMMRKSFWARVGGYSEAEELRPGNEDWDFWISAAERGFRAAHVPELLYRYRTKASSTTTRLAAVDHITREYMYRRHARFIDRYFSRRAFLGEGYWRSANAACASGCSGRCLRLGFRAQFLAPDAGRFRDLLRRVLLNLLPRATLSPSSSLLLKHDAPSANS